MPFEPGKGCYGVKLITFFKYVKLKSKLICKMQLLLSMVTLCLNTFSFGVRKYTSYEDFDGVNNTWGKFS